MPDLHGPNVQQSVKSVIKDHVDLVGLLVLWKLYPIGFVYIQMVLRTLDFLPMIYYRVATLVDSVVTEDFLELLGVIGKEKESLVEDLITLIR